MRVRLSNETRRWAWSGREERGGGVSGGYLAGYALENTDRVFNNATIGCEVYYIIHMHYNYEEMATDRIKIVFIEQYAR